VACAEALRLRGEPSAARAFVIQGMERAIVAQDFILCYRAFQDELKRAIHML